MNQKKGLKNKKKTIAMLLVMAIFISILPDSFTASAAEAIKEATQDTPALAMQFQINSTWGGSIAADIILKNEGSKTIENWEITFDWKPVITSLWCAQYKTEEKSGQEGAADTNRYTIYPYEYNNTISPGSEIRIGLIASGEEAELAEPDLYEIEIGGENWVYDTKEDGLKKPEETEEPTEEPEKTATPEVTESPTKEPEISEEPEKTATPEVTESPTKEPEISEEPEITATPEVTENPTEEPELSAEPTKKPEITSTPEVTEEPTKEPEIMATPEITEKPTATPEETITPTPEPEKTPAPTTTPEPTKEPDYNLEDYEFTDDLVITSDKTLTKNISCKNLYIKKGTLNTDGYKLTVRENAEQSGGRLNIEKESEVTIKGRAALTAGILYIMEGSLHTAGKFTAAGGELQLCNKKSHAAIEGDCRLESQSYISNGILEIKGNLEIPNKNWLRYAGTVNLKLSGSRTQTVTTADRTSLYNLDLTESAGIKFSQTIYAKTLKGIENITSEQAAFAVEEISLTKDTILSYDVEIKSGTWNIGENRLAIEGSLKLAGGTLIANSGAISVEEDFAATGGELQLHKEARITIEGDCRLESQSYISNGIIKIKGNLEIPSKNWLRYAGTVNLKLSGSCTQTVTTADRSSLYNLDLTESAGVEFNRTIYAKTLTGIENIRQETIHLNIEEVKLTKDTELEVGLELEGGKLSTNGYELRLNKSLTIAGGSLNIENGSSVNVKGKAALTAGVLSIMEGNLYAAGTFTTTGGELQLCNKTSHAAIEGDCRLEGQSYISNGMIEIKGNLEIPNKNWLRYAGTVNLKLSGSRTQTVTTADRTSLHNLDLTESAGVKFSQTIYAKTLKGIENITSEQAAFAVEEISLTKDTILSYDVEIKSGTWNIGENRLAIEGSLKLAGGTLIANSGAISVEEDFAATGGELQLHKEARISIEGDCHLESSSYISSGTVEIKENLSIPEKNWLRYANNVTLKLSGSHIQKVTTAQGVYLHNLDLTESKGVTFKNTVNARTLYGIEKLTGRENTLNVSEATNSPYGSTLKGNLIMEGGSLQLKGLHFTIEGDITVNGGAVTPKAERFTIKGSCTLNGGVLDIATGQTTIEKNCQIAGTGAINITENTAALIIGGSLKSSSKAQSRFQAGDIHLAGNLIQAETANEAGLRMQSRLHLNGEEKQTIRLSYPEKSSFAHLDMKSAKEVIIPSVIHAQTIKGLGKAANRYLTICGWIGEIEEYTHYHGELTLVGSVLKTGSHYLTVEKLEQVNSKVIIGEGGITIEGDYILTGDSLLEMKTIGGIVNVEGTLYTASTMSHRESLTEGSLYIGKHLLQEGYNFSFYPTGNLTLCFTQPSPEEGGIIQIVSITGEMSEIIEKQKKENFRRINGGKVEINNILIEDLTPESIYRNFCEGVKEGAIEVTKDLKQFLLWTAIGAGVELTFHGFAIAADLGLLDQGIITLSKTAGTAGVFAIVAYILFSCGWELYTNGGNVNLLARKAGRAAAEVLITALSSMAAAALIEAAITPQKFQKIVQVSVSQIKKAYRTGKAAIEEIMALFTGSKSAAALLSKKLTPQAAKYLDDIVEAGIISEEALQRSSSFLDDALPEAEQIGTTELKTILEQAGTMEDSELSDLVRWLSEKSGTKNGRALEYLDEEAKQYLWKKSAELTEKQLDDILDDIIKEVEGLEEATGVIENVGRKSVVEKVAKHSRKGIFREATQQDIDIISKIRDKYNASMNRNCAACKGTIGGQKIDLEVVSGKSSDTNWFNKGNFNPPAAVDYVYIGPRDYVYHTEQKIIEYLRVLYKENKTILGEIEIISEREFCENCSAIIDMFESEFPNVTITRVEVIK